MKLAVSNIGWTASEDATITERLITAGADAIEVAPGRVFEDVTFATKIDSVAFAERQVKLGLPVLSMQALLFGRPDLRLFGTDSDRNDLLRYLDHVFMLAAALDCRPLVFGSPTNRLRGELTLEEAITKAAPIFREIGALASDHGVVFCLEANAPDYGCDFMCVLQEAGKMCARTGHPNVAMVVDTGNMLLVGEVAESVVPVMKYVAHLHASAPYLGPVHPHQKFVGTVLELARDAGFDGTLTVEMRASPDGIDPLLRSVEMLRSMIDRRSV